MRPVLKLSHQGLILVSVPLVFELILIAALCMLLHEAESKAREESRAKSVLAHTNAFTKNLILCCSQTVHYCATGNRVFLTNYEDPARQVSAELNELNSLLDSANPRMAKIKSNLNTLANSILLTLNEATRSRQKLELYSRLQFLDASLKEITRETREIEEEQKAVERSAPLNQIRQWFAWFLGVAVLFNVAIAFALAYYFKVWTLKRLNVLMNNTMRLTAQEPLNPPLRGSDEIAQLDAVFHDMAVVLETSAKKERAVIDNAVDVICVIDESGRLTSVSPAATRVLGYGPNELIGHRYVKLIEPESLADTANMINEIMRGAEATQFDTRVVRQDRSVIDTLWSVFWSSSDKCLFCVVHDITDRKRAEALLRQSEARSRRIFESVPIGLLIMTQQGVVELANRATDKIFGYDPMEIVGKHILQLFRSFDIQLSDIDAANRSIDLTVLDGLRKHGQEFPAEVSLTVYNTADGERLLVTILDITDKEEVERLKREFVAMVSHELRTPLTSIRGFLQLLSAGVFGEMSADCKTSIRHTDAGAQRLIVLINDLLDVEKLEAGMLSMTMEQIDLNPVLQRSVEAVGDFARQQQVAVTLFPTELSVFADSGRVIQVVVNLLSNAIKFSEPQTTITISVQALSGMVKVSVSDQGCGIPKKYQEVIFERFHQMPGSSEKKGGSGLGLSISKAIAEQHGGAIGVDSVEGQGSTFWFTLPTAASDLATISKPEPQVVHAQKRVVFSAVPQDLHQSAAADCVSVLSAGGTGIGAASALSMPANQSQAHLATATTAGSGGSESDPAAMKIISVDHTITELPLQKQNVGSGEQLASLPVARANVYGNNGGTLGASKSGSNAVANNQSGQPNERGMLHDNSHHSQRGSMNAPERQHGGLDGGAAVPHHHRLKYTLLAVAGCSLVVALPVLYFALQRQPERKSTSSAVVSTQQTLNKTDLPQTRGSGKNGAATPTSYDAMVAFQQSIALGDRCCEQLRWADALPYFRTALDIIPKELTSKNEHAAVLVKYGDCLLNCNRAPEADVAYDQAIAIRKKLGDHFQNDLAVAVFCKARGLQTQHRWQDALPLFEEALAIQKPGPGAEHWVEELNSQIALCYRDKGDYQKAVTLLNAVVKRRRKLGDSFELSQSLGHRGVTLQLMKRFSDAEKDQKESLAMRTRVLGPDHIFVAGSYSTLADLYAAEGKTALSEKMRKQAEAIYKKQ